MPTVLQFRRGTTTQNNSFTGTAGEISVDTDINSVRVHDGSTAGGFTLAKGEASNGAATNVNVTANNTANETVYLTFVDGATGSQGLETDTGLSYNPSTNVLATTASQAQYADLAERYTADADYEAGTVVELGGTEEVTQTKRPRSVAIAGVVSTDPAYLMNSGLENGVSIALLGRVPCKVVGTINKGDILVSSSTPGHAEAHRDIHNPPSGSAIGKAIENKTDEDPGIIEVLVGRM
jgi:hypothetical protein